MEMRLGARASAVLLALYASLTTACSHHVSRERVSTRLRSERRDRMARHRTQLM
jgi:hypothetical protein